VRCRNSTTVLFILLSPHFLSKQDQTKLKLLDFSLGQRCMCKQLRYLAFLSQRGYRFSRLFAVIRALLCRKTDVTQLLSGYRAGPGIYWIWHSKPIYLCSLKLSHLTKMRFLFPKEELFRTDGAILMRERWLVFHLTILWWVIFREQKRANF
jgi:hypothetical protein